MNGFPEPGAYWLVFFTDWSFCLFGVMGILGSIVTVRALLAGNHVAPTEGPNGVAGIEQDRTYAEVPQVRSVTVGSLPTARLLMAAAPIVSLLTC